MTTIKKNDTLTEEELKTYKKNLMKELADVDFRLAMIKKSRNLKS